MLTLFLYKISKIDLATLQIPDEYNLGICILALGLGGFDLEDLNLAIFVLIITSFFMGLGDAKLLAALSLIFKAKVFFVIALSFVLAGLYCTIKLVKRELCLKDNIAFAPFISTAALFILCCY